MTSPHHCGGWNVIGQNRSDISTDRGHEVAIYSLCIVFVELLADAGFAMDTTKDTTQDYAEATLVKAKGKWYVSVTVPINLRPYFNDRCQIKRSTGTTDRIAAGQKLHGLASAIYEEFNKVQPNPLRLALQRLSELHKPNDLLPKILPSVADNINYDAHLSSDESDWELAAFVDGHMDAIILHCQTLEHTAFGPVFDAAQAVLGEIKKHRDGERPQTKKFMDVASAYVGSAAMHGTRLSSTRKAIGEFDRTFPEVTLNELTKVHFYEYATILAEDGMARNTIKGRIARLSSVFKSAEKKGLVDGNPTVGLDYADLGRDIEHWKPFTKDQLHQIFLQPMNDRERLLFTMLVTTGMRLDEAALLEWQDVKDKDGIPYFDLTRADLKIKNKGSRRFVPIVADLRNVLGEAGSGRIFNYRLNALGKTSDASIVCMKHIRAVTANPLQVNHSFRGTIKDLMRDEGVAKEVNDYITGHGSGDAAGRYGVGPSVSVRYEQLSRVSHPWLTP